MAVEQPVRSPCVSICALDEDDICIGCYRTVGEITLWARMDNTQRAEVIERCRERTKRNNPFSGN